jgi:hypothetical protein
MPAAVVCHGAQAVAPFLLHRSFLVVVPRPLSATPLAVLRTYLTVLCRGRAR